MGERAKGSAGEADLVDGLAEERLRARSGRLLPAMLVD